MVPAGLGKKGNKKIGKKMILKWKRRHVQVHWGKRRGFEEGLNNREMKWDVSGVEQHVVISAARSFSIGKAKDRRNNDVCREGCPHKKFFDLWGHRAIKVRGDRHDRLTAESSENVSDQDEYCCLC